MRRRYTYIYTLRKRNQAEFPRYLDALLSISFRRVHYYNNIIVKSPYNGGRERNTIGGGGSGGLDGLVKHVLLGAQRERR